MDGPCIVSLVCADDRKQVITFQELTSSLDSDTCERGECMLRSLHKGKST